MHRAWLVLAIGLLCVPRAAWPQQGNPVGPEFRINTYTTNIQNEPAVTADASGNFVVVWDSANQDGSLLGVFGQRFGSSGAPLGPEFRVNTSTADLQFAPSVAADSAGNFVVAWTSYQDGNLDGIFARRFGGLGPAALAVDTAGNQVFEPG